MHDATTGVANYPVSGRSALAGQVDKEMTLGRICQYMREVAGKNGMLYYSGHGSNLGGTFVGSNYSGDWCFPSSRPG